ncbi:flagellar export chaperone FlgN [Leifsonia sp. McL0608]|uniref:flagellar protein FlgN n=1 Tax=Leifsonia sp. McL0608 TaxID=3143537 RepID=UPI003D9C1D6D
MSAGYSLVAHANNGPVDSGGCLLPHYGAQCTPRSGDTESGGCAGRPPSSRHVVARFLAPVRAEIVESEIPRPSVSLAEFHPRGSHVGATELSAQLWKERALIELLLFKLDELELIVADNRSRWVPRATKEIEQVLDRMSTAGLARAIDVSGVAEEWGCSPEAGLRELVAAAPAGVWGDLLDSHLQALLDLAGEVREATQTCQRLLRSAMEWVPDSGLTAAIPPDAEQSLETATHDANYRLALAVTARVLRPALEDFLR